MKNKRGIEISFQLIFAMIAGMIIFLFLIYFAFQNVDLFGTKANIIARSEFNNALDSFGAAQISSKLEFDDEIEFNFLCGSNTNSFGINDDRRESLRGKIVFSRGIKDERFSEGFTKIDLKGSRFGVWSLPWEAPYKIANFIIFNREGVKYKLDSDFTALDVRDIPNFFSEESAAEINVDKVLGVCSRTSNEGEIQVYIEDENAETIEGRICNSIGEYSFKGKAMVYAAIFSEPEYFNCIYNNFLLNRMSIMEEHYKNKARYLQLQNQYGECSSDYTDIIRDMGRDMGKRADVINARNKILIGKGCPAVF